MKSGKVNWGKFARFILCLLLLLWIFHSIFLTEARAAYTYRNLSWDQLPRGSQWRAAWLIGPGQLWSTLSTIHPGYLLLSILLVGVIILFGIIRWRLVLLGAGLRLSFWRIAEISLIAHFFNSFLLGTTGGDLLKAYYAARETHHKKIEAVVTVFVDRLLGFLAMLLFATAFMAPNRHLIQNDPSMKTLSTVVAAMFAGVFVVALIAFWGGLSRLWPPAHTLLTKIPKGDLIERSLRSCRSFGRQPGRLLALLACSMVLNAFSVLQVLALGRGLGLDLPILTLLLIVPMIICISSLPITPSGLGVRENLFVALLAAPPLLVPGKVAISLSLLAYAGNLLWSLAGGVIYLCVKEREHLPEITSEENDGLSSVAP